MTTSTLSPGGEDGLASSAGLSVATHLSEGQSARARRLQRLDRPLATGAVALGAGVLVTVARLVFFAKGDPSRFIVASTTYASHIGHYYPIQLFSGTGYDGQFFYRLALDPANFAQTAFGITLDTGLRLQRIGYPAIAWLVTAGRGSLVPWALIGVNVVALGVLGFIGGALARDAGRHALGGLLLGFWGFAFSLSRDTAEIPAAALTLAALLALRRRRPWHAAALFSAAVLTRETALLVVAAVALEQLFVRLWPAREPSHTDRHAPVVWIAPAVAFATWQAVIFGARDHVVATTDRGNLGVPLQGLAVAIHNDFLTITQPRSLRDVMELAVLVGVVVLALKSLRTSSSPRSEKVALILMVFLAIVLSDSDVASQANQRSLDLLFLLAGVVLLGSRRRLAVPGVLAAALFLAVAVPAALSV